MIMRPLLHRIKIELLAAAPSIIEAVVVMSLLILALVLAEI
jgi:hypothetical protein